MLGVLTGFYVWGTSIDTILMEWDQIGIFRYVLPFLLIFAIIFGILQKSGLLGDEAKGVNVVIAFAIGLLALQFNYVHEFFATIFPFAGIGISILLVLLILTGLFQTGNEGWWNKTFFGIGLFIAVVVVLVSLSHYQWTGGGWWYQNWSLIVTVGIIVGLMVLVILATKSKTTTLGAPRT